MLDNHAVEKWIFKFSSFINLYSTETIPSSQESSVGWNCFILKTPSYNEDMTVINIYIPNNIASTLKQQKWWKDAYPLQEKEL